MEPSDFARKTGKISIPTAQAFAPDRNPIQPGDVYYNPVTSSELEKPLYPRPYRLCHTDLKAGCYTITIASESGIVVRPRYWQGTIRVDKVDGDLCISGDLYNIKQLLVGKQAAAGMARESAYEISGWDSLYRKKTIPVYARRSYYAYLLGTGARLYALADAGDPCPFSLDFDLYPFTHDPTGYEGTFPNAPTKSVRLALQATSTVNRYVGKIYEGKKEIGIVGMEWISSYFRKAYLDIHTLQGSVAPQAVDDPDGTGMETFKTIFATAGWDLTVSYKTPDITLPASLVGVQAADDCWSRVNSHELLETASTYDAAVLDKKWKVHLLAMEGELGCGRGRMFDNEIDAGDIGDANNVAREGAVTYSDDGYDDPDFGDNENDLQKDTPRAYLRSAAHEVGHAFNMIHQSDEAGNDNSIMTTSPGMAGVLNAAGLDFPEDINLGFNALCRHHLVHRPDPWVRPGALEFTGSLVGTPEADDVYFYDATQLKLVLALSGRNIKLGEVLDVSWKVTNSSKSPITFPERITDSSFTARVSITYPDGSIRYVRPVEVNADIENRLTVLKAGESRTSETMLFWNKKGFAFSKPGRHTIEVYILWAEQGRYSCVHAAEDIWVDYPVTAQENEVAALMLQKDVGRYVAFKGRKPIKKAIDVIEEVVSKYKSHPACRTLKEIPGHRYSVVKPAAKMK